ncbi:hypothetical protein NEF87_001838 [Candidatus Lokiarchaeum ossiferum]|uniref:HTH marR-type domain-containing protein n=1 Tax=Candidatus Lokiarchaeum ossiferum TaxID=2951803 RepID=A0ABY6HPW2_9ARCH|nr:hypothetical protein NEF87_001838 [Candidatus Lokiarchaeum sp. B-35]
MRDFSSIGLLIAQIHQTSDRVFERKLREASLQKLSASQGRVLFLLESHEKITVHKLSQLASLSNSTLSQLLDSLEKKGIISRVRNTEDRRKVHIVKTSLFDQYFLTYKNVLEEMITVYFKDFAPDQRKLFEKMTLQVLSNLVKEEHESSSNDS